ncbi:MAG: four helix bundle protein [Saprospiraceae bacterium]|nr:four helix bundle protein [Saprospiraceae bacterium]
MVIKKFQEIIAWQKAKDFAIEIYKHFRELKDYAFKDQICRAAVSISNNIAEGFDRSSDADFVRFLYIAKGSCSELQSMIYIAHGLQYINTETQINLETKSNEIGRLIRGLIKSIQKHK